MRTNLQNRQYDSPRGSVEQRSVEYTEESEIKNSSQKIPGTGEQYYSFVPNQNEIDLNQSNDFSEKLQNINRHYMALQRMVRPPVFKWAESNLNEEEQKNNPYDSAQVRIFAVTWNMQGKAPRLEDLKALLHPELVHHDVFCIGSQESLKTIAGSMFAPSKEAMNHMIASCLGENFRMVSSVSLQATHLTVFAHI